jgi:hypothetical protein
MKKQLLFLSVRLIAAPLSWEHIITDRKSPLNYVNGSVQAAFNLANAGDGGYYRSE